METNVQYSIIKNPIPFLIGNTSLLPANAHEYTYTSSYIVNDNATYDNEILLFDTIQNKWALHFKIIERYETINRSNYFPQLSSSIGVYSMNGFVNNECGYPEFYSEEYTETDEQTFHFNKFMNSWCYGYRCKSISGEIYTQRAVDTNDCRTGDFYVYHNISAFVQDKREISYAIYKNYKLIEGDPTVPSSLLKFRNNDGNIINGKIINHKNSYLRSDESPNIISGEPCLGYYYKDNDPQPYVIGSFCIGTEDLTTIPPIIGQNYSFTDLDYYDPIVFNYNIIYHNIFRYYIDPEKGSNCPDVFPGCISGIWDEAAYLWVGTTFDKSKTKWNLYQIKSYKWGEIGPQYSFNTYILLSGGFPNVDPCTAENFYYMQSNIGNLFSYDNLSGGLTFKAYPEGEDIELKIVGLTNFNADEIKHPNKGEDLYLQTYIGNWLAPQSTWRTE